jgi:2-dehydro-3-deoxy-D-arabinonate dehydratase
LVGSLPGPDDEITLSISRNGEEVFRGKTAVSQLKRGYDELAGFLFKENDFPDGALLMTGTGVVPDHPFTLQSGDEVSITIDGIGTLTNTVAPAGSMA